MIKTIKRIAKNLKYEIKIYQLIIKDPRTPEFSKLLLWLSISYVLLPFDIIPDFIPFLGQLDDLIIVPILIYISLAIVPKEVIEDCKRKAQESIKKII